MTDDGITAGATAPRGGKRSERMPIWLAPLALAVGAAFVLVAFLIGRTELRYDDEGVATQATIVRLWVDAADDDEGSDTYHVGYEFSEPASARTFRGSGEVGLLRWSGLRIGDTIEVSYLKSDPSENRLGGPEPRLLLPIAIGGFGGLCIAVVPLLLVSSIRERRMRRAPTAIAAGNDDLRRIDVFTRSPMHAAGGPVALMAGVGFLITGLFGVTEAAAMPSLLMLTLFCGVIGTGLIASGITSFRRGFGLTLAEVGPGGVWLLGIGRAAWADLAEVRVEQTLRSASDDEGKPDAAPTVASRRLGFMPRDERLLDQRPDRLSRALGRMFFSLLNKVQSRARLVTDSQQSPYGISETELEQPFDALVASVARFTSVATRQVQPLGGTEVEPAASRAPLAQPDRPLGGTELLEVDARLARHPEDGTRFVDGD